MKKPTVATLVAALLALVACGDNAQPPSSPDAGAVDAPVVVDASVDASVDPICVAPALEAIACHPKLPGAFCTQTFVPIGAARGCCVFGHFYACEAP